MTQDVNFDLTRLIKLMGLTGSDSDHEALMAVRAANREIHKIGKSWAEILSGRVKVIGDPFVGLSKPETQSRVSTPKPPPTPTTNSTWSSGASDDEAQRRQREAAAAAPSPTFVPIIKSLRTFHIKEDLKRMGCWYDGAKRQWSAPADKFAEILKFVQKSQIPETPKDVTSLI